MSKSHRAGRECVTTIVNCQGINAAGGQANEMDCALRVGRTAESFRSGEVHGHARNGISIFVSYSAGQREIALRTACEIAAQIVTLSLQTSLIAAASYQQVRPIEVRRGIWLSSESRNELLPHILHWISFGRGYEYRSR